MTRNTNKLHNALLVLGVALAFGACTEDTDGTGGSTGGEMAGGAMPGGEMPGGEMPGGAMAGGAMAGGAMPGGEMAGGEMAGGEMAGGEATCIQYFQCNAMCGEDVECDARCQGATSNESMAIANAVITCISDAGCGPADAECANRECSDQIMACQADGAGDLTCLELQNCFAMCPPEDEACSDQCFNSASLDARTQFITLIQCLQMNAMECIGAGGLINCDECLDARNACENN